MSSIYYTKSGKKYTIDLCELADVDIHYDVIRKLVVDTDESAYKERMHRSVQEDTAYKVTEDGKSIGFLYLYKEHNKWAGASIWSNDPIGLMMLMVEITKKHGFINIRFTPHTEMIKQYKSLLSGSSIRQYRSGRSYVTVNTGKLKEKFAEMLSYLGVAE